MDKKNISCIIVDDEPLSVSLLESYTGNCADTRLLKTFTNPIDALHFMGTCYPDVVLLDVQMPELSGIQFMNILQKKSQVILTTAYTDYAVNAFDLDVVDYLLKPISYERFLQAIDKVKAKKPADFADDASGGGGYFFVKSEYRLVKVFYKDVLYLEGLRDYVAIHTRQHKLLTLQSMKSFEESLPGYFIRVHKSYIVNYNAITSLKGNSVLLDNRVIPVGAVYAHQIKDKLKKG